MFESPPVFYMVVLVVRGVHVTDHRSKFWTIWISPNLIDFMLTKLVLSVFLSLAVPRFPVSRFERLVVVIGV